MLVVLSEGFNLNSLDNSTSFPDFTVIQAVFAFFAYKSEFFTPFRQNILNEKKVVTSHIPISPILNIFHLPSIKII